MKPSQWVYNMIKESESLRLKAYPDPATNGAPWTVGWGHTGKDINPATIITVQQAIEFLEKDVAKAIALLEAHVVEELTQGQFDALVDFVFNVGPGAKGIKDGLVYLKNGSPSSLLRYVNAGQFQAASNEFLKWNRAAGKVLKGLTIRREKEKRRFLAVN